MLGRKSAEVDKLEKMLEAEKSRSERNIKQAREVFEDKVRELNRTIEDLKEPEARYKKRFEEEKALAYKAMELEFKSKHMDEVAKIRKEYDEKLISSNEDNFNKLREALAKLHQEGNAQTKFTEQIALKMMDSIKPGVFHEQSRLPKLQE
jgi:hypothetical protein